MSLMIQYLIFVLRQKIKTIFTRFFSRIRKKGEIGRMNLQWLYAEAVAIYLYSWTEWSSRSCGRQALYYWDGELCPGFCGKLWLATLNNSKGWRETETCYPELAGTVFGPFDKTGCSARGLYIQEESREKNLRLGHPRLSWFQMARQHVILILGLSPHPLRL